MCVYRCIKGRAYSHCQETDRGMVREVFNGMGGGCSSLSPADDRGTALLLVLQRGGRGGRIAGPEGTALLISMGRYPGRRTKIP